MLAMITIAAMKVYNLVPCSVPPSHRGVFCRFLILSSKLFKKQRRYTASAIILFVGFFNHAGKSRAESFAVMERLVRVLQS
jgi:hypothetical protein